MNLLAGDPAAVLMPREIPARVRIEGGRHGPHRGSSFGNTTELQLRIAGQFELLPSWSPDSGPLFVGNLDHYFEQPGYAVPYQVWLRHGQVARLCTHRRGPSGNGPVRR